MSESPTKRRKTNHRVSINSKKFKMAVVWPQDEIPVEIFAIVVSFLSRSNVQNMRLVNKEFEQKVSQYLFKTVVVPFRPEIYGIAEELNIGSRELTKSEDQHAQGKVAVVLQDKGMRVFQGFGRHIHRFAMSFEFDYGLLTKPPLKSDQEAITTFWGIYRWPYKAYHRYEALEGLEQTADETRTMAKALRFVKECKELGLSIDGGLGWLAGPDVNSKVQIANEDIVVFGPSAFPQEEKRKAAASKSKGGKVLTSALDLTSLEEDWKNFQVDGQPLDDPENYSAWLQMLREAGYEGRDLLQSIQTLRESEGISETPSPDSSFDSPWRSSSSVSSSLSSSQLYTSTGESTPRARRVTDLILQRIGYEGAILDRLRSLLNMERQERHLRPTEGRSTSPLNSAAEALKNLYPLKPNDLTTAQKEMLLETEWAQRAFMQSYAIAVIDNSITFIKVQTLTIARLPSRHLPILMRADFWSSLSNLKNLSLAVIPDWRDVIKLPTSWVDDIRVHPSQATSGVYQLLRDHIAPNKSITNLHFEWLCGGEEDTGIFARNQHILAAPLLPQALNMISRHSQVQVLRLPHVQNLSLKNCWVSPHIFIDFTTELKTQALQSLTLRSISLTAPAANITPAPVLGHQLAPQALNNGPNHAVNNQGGVLQAAFQAVPGAANSPPTTLTDWLDPPRHGSWAQVIDKITPGETLARMRFARDDDGLGDAPPAPTPTVLRRIEFQSCGYVRLSLDFDQSMLDPPEGRQAGEGNTAAAKRRTELEQFMMKTNDRTLAAIVNHISDEEAKTLENAWDLSLGWGEAQKILAAQAKADGVKNAGQGRFRGTILGIQP